MCKKIYPCTVAACDEFFFKAYELKKHLAVHKDPKSVFFCPECNFITLQKKNLAIHVATHTGEKPHHCPHVVLVDAGTEERCAFRTNDPAALTKHRKRVHSYIPNRSRKATHPPFSKRREVQNARRLLQPPHKPAPHKPLTRSSSTSDVGSSTACTSTSTNASDGHTSKRNAGARVDPILSADIRSWLDSTDAYGHPMQADASGDTLTRHPWSEDPELSTQARSLDAFGDHARRVWAETDALMRSMSLDSLDASAPHPWAETDAYPQSSFAGFDYPWAETDALMRSASLDSLDASVPDPWAEPDVRMQSTTAGCLDASANDRGASHPWELSPFSNVFGNNPTLHPWGETDAHKQSSPAVTFDASGTNPMLHPWPGNPSHVQSTPDADAPTFDQIHNAYILAGAASVAPGHGMDLSNLYDLTLCADWMAAYEFNYSNADPTGVTHVVDPVVPSLVVPGAQTGHEGCLCPEWMNEAGVEGWDQVDTHKECYAF